MSMALTVAPAIRFHLSLNVSDLSRSIDFYRILFGTEPAKRRPDYAKFELDDPPLVLSLEPTPRAVGGPLNHLGFRVPDSATLVAMQVRLEQAGIHSKREEGVECCYARQTKFWVTDPDKTLWELYTLHEDIDHRGAGQSLEDMIPDADHRPTMARTPARVATEPATANGNQEVYEHRLTAPVPERLPLADASVDEVRLRGSLNVPLDSATQQRLAREALRVLRPGGRVFAHTLVGERPLSNPGLPGPAAAVQFVPPESDPVRLLEAAGFQGLRLLKFDAKPCFQREGVAMREQQLEGFKPVSGSTRVVVVYKGPFRQVIDDDGTIFVRGERVAVEATRAERLRSGEWEGQFLVLP
jgi:catechol 2,3-dioxygenase-like lactoylglutathione lyase family enzyme/SAM-dependent methyltransferase